MTRKFIICFLFLAVVQLLGCASRGHLKYEGKSYTLNRSEIHKKDDQYRIWAWREVSMSFPAFMLPGPSPAGIQLFLPENIKKGTTYNVEEDCKLLVRGLWDFFRFIFGKPQLWVSANSGTISILEWIPETMTIAGTFEAQTKKGPISGKFRVRPEVKYKKSSDENKVQGSE